MMKINSESENIKDSKGKLYPECLIIEHEHQGLKKGIRYAIENIFTIILWIFWFYLWVPILVILIEESGLSYINIYIKDICGLSQDEFHHFLNELHYFSLYTTALIASTVCWSFYNYKLYKWINKNRTIKNNDKYEEDLALCINTSKQRLSEIQKSKRIVFNFSDDDSVKRIDIVSA